jgi:hypothetical protein
MNTPTIALGHDLRVQEVAVKDVDMNEERFRVDPGKAETASGSIYRHRRKRNRFADRHILPLPLPLRDLCFCVCAVGSGLLCVR